MAGNVEPQGGTWPEGSTPPAQAVKRRTLADPNVPAREGSTFEGWYKEAVFANKITFPCEVSADITLYAKWTGEVGNKVIILTGIRLGSKTNAAPSSVSIGGTTYTANLAKANSKDIDFLYIDNSSYSKMLSAPSAAATGTVSFTDNPNTWPTRNASKFKKINITEAEFEAADAAKITELTAGGAGMTDAVRGISPGDVYGIITAPTSVHPDVAGLIRIESVSGIGLDTRINVTMKVCGYPVAVTGVTLDKTALTLVPGKMATLTATVAPENAIVSSAGVVTATAKDGDFKVECAVTVSKPMIMTMTTTITGEAVIQQAGTGAATIDWGDKSGSETVTLSNNSYRVHPLLFRHNPTYHRHRGKKHHTSGFS